MDNEIWRAEVEAKVDHGSGSKVVLIILVLILLTLVGFACLAFAAVDAREVHPVQQYNVNNLESPRGKR